MATYHMSYHPKRPFSAPFVATWVILVRLWGIPAGDGARVGEAGLFRFLRAEDVPPE